MMNRSFWMIVAVVMLQACAHKGYTISGELSGANGLKVVLKKMTADSADPVAIDSCVVKKGKFMMKGTVEYPEYCALYVGDNGPLMLFVENTIINIAVDLNNMQDSEVTGSKETDLLVDFNKKMIEFEEIAGKMYNDYMSEENDAEREKEYVAQSEQIQQKRINYMKQFAEEHPNSMVTALIVNCDLSYYLFPEELEEMELYAEGFDAVNSRSPWVQSIMEKAATAKRLSIGQPFIDLKMSAPDGNEIALSDYIGKDKYVLIDFWASWCSPCRKANPQMVKIYDQYKDKGLEIVGISFDWDKTEWVRVIEADALVWPQMSDLQFWKSEGAKLYSVNSIPYTILLDKDGIILDKGLEPDKLEMKLAVLLE